MVFNQNLGIRTHLFKPKLTGFHANETFYVDCSREVTNSLVSGSEGAPTVSLVKCIEHR
jgi:hypothetical protein